MNATARNAFLAVLAVIVVVGGFLIFSQRPGAPAAVGAAAGADTRTVTYSQNGQSQTATLVKVATDPFEGARFVRGQESAPVTVVEFADYQCPGCGFFATNVESQFKTEFVDTGKVRYAFRDYPLDIHPNAPLAATAAACANVEKRWEPMHDILFRSQQQWAQSSGDAFRAQLVDFAKQVGLDDAAFQTCLSSNQFRDAIERDRAVGNAVGLSGTPTFVINGYRLDTDRVPSIETLRALMTEFGVK
jgi:protein-disulfide isomerase